MEELWKILRDIPKFNEKHVVPKRKRNMEVLPTQNSGVFSHNVEPIGIDDTLEQPTSTLEIYPVHQDLGGEKDNTSTYKYGVQRPEMGRKKSKEKRRNEVTSQETSKLLKEFISNFDASMKQQFSLSEKEIKSKEDMVRKDHELKERHLKQKEEELHQQAQQMKLTKWLAEKDILEKDLAGMTHPQAELFRKIQHDILEKWMRDSTVP